MAQRAPVTRIGGAFKELPAGDSLVGGLPLGGAAGQILAKGSAAAFDAAWVTPDAFKLIATTGDLSATPVAAVTFAGLAAYTDLLFEFIGVGHDYTSAAQTISAAFSVDGTNYSAANAISPSISSSAQITGQSLIVGNGGQRLMMRTGLGTGNNLAPPVWASPTEAPRILVAGAALATMRFIPTTSGNFNKGILNAYGR